jgi:hypothetical protein
LRKNRRSLTTITESILLQYVRDQLDQEPKPTPSTINHRLACIIHQRGIVSKRVIKSEGER